MKNKMHYLAVAVSLAFSATAVWADDDLKTESKQAIDKFKSTDSSMSTFFNNSAGYAVFPNVGKGGLIVGGAHGKGMVFEKGGTPIGQATMTQASIGAQAGGQTFSQIIFFETPASLSDFKEGKFEMRAGVSAIAVKEGASTSANYKEGVAVFTLPKKGLMVEASVGGQKFKFEPESGSNTNK